jgi:hypothetical protein
MVFRQVSWKSLLAGALLTSLALPAFASFQVTTSSTTPASATRGKTITLSTAVQASVYSPNMIVDLEVYNPAGTKVAQTFYQSQTFGAGQNAHYNWKYAVPATAATGNYTLKVGVFNSAWSLVYWDNTAVTFPVSATGGTGTGTAVNGACGAVNGQSLTTAPTSNLCSAGTASAVSGSGPWTWSCTGTGGGTKASCSASHAAAAGTQGAVPTGLPGTLFVGLSAGMGTPQTWVKNSGVPWAMCYQYISSGVLPAQSWVTTWGTNFAYNYAVAAHTAGCMPELTYYQIVPTGGEGQQAEAATLKNSTLMADYYKDFTALMKQLHTYGSTAVVHVEPDMFGYFEQLNSNPAAISASVASSGNTDVAGYPNTLAGFGEALLHLRDLYAPNVVMAAHVSTWMWGSSTSASVDVTTYAKTDAAFMTGLGNWDLFFTDVSDRDSGYYQFVEGDPSHWWDTNNVKFPNFNRFNTWAKAFTTAAHKRLVIWQIPIGNTIMKTSNNTNYHYQDNREQYWLENYPTNQAMSALEQAGVIGLLFGAGNGGTTQYYDAAGDGITNPAPINGNTRVSTVSDDDGGLLRINVGNYYRSGATPLK